MTLEEVADYLRVHPITIKRKIKEKNFPAINISGSAKPMWRFRKEDIEQWLKNQ